MQTCVSTNLHNCTRLFRMLILFFSIYWTSSFGCTIQFNFIVKQTLFHYFCLCCKSAELRQVISAYMHVDKENEIVKRRPNRHIYFLGKTLQISLFCNCTITTVRIEVAACNRLRAVKLQPSRRCPWPSSFRSNYRNYTFAIVPNWIEVK